MKWIIFQGFLGFCFAMQGGIVTTLICNINSLHRMHLAHSWMVNVHFYGSTDKRLNTMLKSCGAGAVKYSPLDEEAGLFLCMHHASYLETSEAEVLRTRGRSFMRWTTKSFWDVSKWAKLCPKMFIDFVSSPFNGINFRNAFSLWKCR